MDIESTLFYSTESSLENKIRKSLNDTYGNERPSRKSLSTILSFYECRTCRKSYERALWA